MHDVLAKFPDAKRDGAGWAAKCPAHDDRKASLSIGTGGDDRVLLHCHAGCALEAILVAANLTTADLFTQATKTNTKTSIVAEYVYCDEGGAHLFTVCRFDPKDFRQRRADGVWKMAGVRRVLYRLPELQGQSIAYVAEGERDVDNLRAIGLPATTNAGGAGKWRAEYCGQLKAASVEHVVILPDHDDPGRAHADSVAQSCHAAGLKVKIVTLPGLPPKGDVTDWLKAGGTKAALVAVAKATPIYIPTPTNVVPVDPFTLTAIGDLLAEPEETVDWLVEARIPAGGLAMMAAKPKVGKSTAARGLALAVARGSTWLGHPCIAGMVWYLAFEGRRRDVRAHFRQMGARPDDTLRVFVGQAPKDIIASVRRLAERERPALIIIDTMQRFLRAQSTDDYAEMTTLFDLVIGIAQESGATIVLLHHSGKAERVGLDAVLGSTAITGSVDTVIQLTRTERFRTVSTVQRTGDDLEETVILLDETTGQVKLGASRQNADEALVGESILQALQNADGPLTEAQIEELVDARTGLKRRALRQLVAREQANRIGRGGKGDPYRYAVSCSGSHVPYYIEEQENNNPHSVGSPLKPTQDSCSHIPTQDSCSQENDDERF